MKPIFITIILFLVLPALASAAGLHGTYTIGGKSPDFNSFHEAAKALNDSGVSAAVIFNVRDGRYNDSLKISFVKGSSLTNTMTFQSESGDSSKVILYSNALNGVFILNNASYITIQKMTINCTRFKPGLYYAGISCSGTHNNFLHNEFDSGPLIFGYNKHCKISNNLFSHNSLRSLSLGNDTSAFSNIEIFENIFYPGSILVSGNKISIHNNSILLDSLYNTGMGFAEIYNSMIYDNKIKASPPPLYGCIGIAFEESGDNKNSDYVFNNFIVLKKAAYNYGIFFQNDTNLYLYHNSILIGGNGTAFFGYESEYSLYNNIFASDSGDNLIEDDYYTGFEKSDYNIFYEYKYSYTGLADRQKYGKDKHSIVANPGFLSTFDLHTFSSNLKGKGTPLSMVTTDIDGEIRNATHPDIGADEFGFLKDDDVGIAQVYAPTGCASDSAITGFRIKNYGLNTEKSLKIAMRVSGATLDSQTYSYTGALMPGRDTIIYSGFTFPLNTSKGGKYNYTAYTELYSDSNHINDTTNFIFNVRPLPNSGFTFSALNNIIDFSANNKTLKTYTWNFGDTSLVDTLVNPSHTYPKKSGSYIASLSVSDSFGCLNLSRDTLSIIYTGVENMNNSTLAVNISPNPVKNILELRGPLERGMIYIMDMEGRAYQSKEVMKGTGPINTDVSSLPKGMYLLKYISERGIWMYKFIKE